MKPEDLKNSDEELKATPEESNAADTPEQNPENTSAAPRTTDEKAAAESQEKKDVAEEETASIENEEDQDEKVIAEASEEKAEDGSAETRKQEAETPEEVAEATEVRPEASGESAIPDQDETPAPEIEAEGADQTEQVEEAASEPSEEEAIDEEAEEETTIDEEAVAGEEVVGAVEEEAEIPEEVAEVPETQDAEKEVVEPVSEEKEEREEQLGFAEMTEVELINALRNLVENHADENIRADIESIRVNFYKKHRATEEEEKEKFLAGGGSEEDFEPSNAPYEDDLRNLLKDYRQQKSQSYREQEDEKEDNLQRKYEIIEEIRNLVNRKESINKTFQEFRDLQQEWREIGLVPQSKLKDLWETYHHHVENFYDYIKINRELRDLDLKKNMEAKIILCEKAEELLVEPSVIKAFNILQKYHEQWREIGPVPRDKKEELWDRFKAATSKINKKHQGYFEGRKQEQKKNLEAKEALCEKAEEIAGSEITNHKDWDIKSHELIRLQKVWRTIGFAPKKDNNLIYERFRTACDKFFDAKRDFYSQNKELQQNNLQMKTDLCVQAEALKDSTDWRKTTEEFIGIQRKWKEIGPVPRKQSDTIWNRFRSACDYFFDNKSKHFHHIDEEQFDNLKLKKELIKEVKNYKLTKDEDQDLNQIKEFQRRWTDIGHVPFRDKDSIQNEFREAINKHFDSLKIDDHKRNLLRFKSKMGNISGTARGNNQMRFEREKYVSKLKQLESDLTLLNNNIGFFANTKNAESLIDDVNRKIADTEEKIVFLKEKINIIDAMDDED